jgi:uncharacterized protein DUF222/HNH endonuclease
MGTLRSALDEIAVQELSALDDDELTDHVGELERATRVLEAERARAIAEIEARRAFAADGFLSAAAWLRHRLGIPASVAGQQVRLARALPHMPRTRAALGDGAIPVAAAAMLALAHDEDPEAFARCEDALVHAAGTLPVPDLRRAIEHWRLLADVANADEAARRRFERRGVFVSTAIDGMVRLDGDLDPETGQTVITAIRAMVDATARGADADDRRPAQRRADALGEICRRYLDSADRPVVAGERPHLTVTVDLATLGSARGNADLDDGNTIMGESARRMACDASVARVITRGRSQPLDVGRLTSVVPAALRRAVIARDRGCRFPGCDRPHAWCDAHHVVHWADGGPTALSNLVLLCRRHHRAVHERFRLRMIDGHPAFTREDGSSLEDRAPP